jgi:hypothetical protein
MPLPRRHFLQTTLAGLAAGVAALPIASSASSSEKNNEKEKHSKPKLFDDSGLPQTLFLTWQRDPTTTISIQWIAPADGAPAHVEYAPWNQTNWQRSRTLCKPYPSTDLSVIRCELTGLTPGTEYQFRLSPEGTISRFRTMPATATDTLQFVSGGDCGVNPYAVATNRLAAAQEPWFALIGGDLAYDNGTSPDTFTRFLTNYSTQMIDPQGRRIPMISCMGNHEVISGSSRRREDAPQYLSVFDGLFPETTYGVLDIGDYLSLVLLDSGHVSPVTGAQTDWLRQTLAARQERPHLIVANHVPAYPSYRSLDDSDTKGTGYAQRKHWCPLFERYQVDAVLEHHDHTFKRTHPLINGLRDENGVVYLGDGSWGRLRPLKDPEKRPYLARAASTYHMTVHRLEGDTRFHVALESTGKLADVSMTHGKRPARRA